MGWIYFHSPEKTEKVNSNELFCMDRRISNFFLSVLDTPSTLDKSLPFFDIIPGDSYLFADFNITNLLRFLESFRVWVRSTEGFIALNEVKRDLFPIKLNTALRIGNDQLKLMSRLNGQCEMHCYVEPENRKWLAKILQKGLAAGIYREDRGWESVVSLLLDGCDSPVVTSSDCCGQFPNAEIARVKPSIDKKGEENWDSWNNTRPKDQWELAMWGLRENKEHLELTPENWEDFYFSDGWDALKLNKLFTVPRSQWSKLIKTYEESQLPATESWTLALSQLDV